MFLSKNKYKESRNQYLVRFIFNKIQIDFLVEITRDIMIKIFITIEKYFINQESFKKISKKLNSSKI